MTGSARKCGYCRATGHDRRKCPKLDACPKKHADGRECCKIINHEGACASIEGKWMISWKDGELSLPENEGNGGTLGLLASTIRDEFTAYIRGWSDGAGIHAMRPEFTSHATLATPYNEGYADGRKARNAAHVTASEKYGVKLSILRTPEPIVKAAKRKCDHCDGTGDSKYEPNAYCTKCHGEGEVE
jgi:hypothetical protein